MIFPESTPFFGKYTARDCLLGRGQAVLGEQEPECGRQVVHVHADDLPAPTPPRLAFDDTQRKLDQGLGLRRVK